tara:strand:+ start:154 stop:360 length:207 start_codon:yes stop_codon:yes gene_type:complete
MIILNLIDSYGDKLNFYLNKNDTFITEEVDNGKKKSKIYLNDNIFHVQETTEEIDKMIKDQILIKNKF